MENQAHHDDPTPSGCFRREELEVFQSFELQILQSVNYYLWLDAGETAAYRFLYALELIFQSGETLLLSCGEESEAIHIISAEMLLQTASRLQELHGQPLIQRVVREGQGVWEKVAGEQLTAIQLKRHESGLYRNDVLMLDFDSTGIVVGLPETGEGLEIREV